MPHFPGARHSVYHNTWLSILSILWYLWSCTTLPWPDTVYTTIHDLVVLVYCGICEAILHFLVARHSVHHNTWLSSLSILWFLWAYTTLPWPDTVYTTIHDLVVLVYCGFCEAIHFPVARHSVHNNKWLSSLSILWYLWNYTTLPWPDTVYTTIHDLTAVYCLLVVFTGEGDWYPCDGNIFPGKSISTIFVTTICIITQNIEHNVMEHKY